MAISGKFVTLPRTALVSIALLLGFAAIPCVSHAQDPASGILPFSTQSGGTYDTVDLATGNIVIKIPLRDKAGKIPFSYSLVSNSHAYKNRNTPPGTVISSGFSGQLSTGFTVRYTKTSENDGCTYLVSHYTALSAIDSTGASHPAPIDFYDRTASDGCLNPVVFPVAFKTSDGSGLTIVATGSSGGPPSAVTWVIYDKSGNVYNSNAVIQDPDGATITKTVNLGVTTYMDSLGTTALAVIPSNGSTPDQYQYAEQNGQPQTLFEVNYSTYTQQTVFGCVADIPPTSVSLPSSINTPYGTFTISYEPTPGNPTHVTGRIAQLTYPSGGFVAYAYHGGVNDVGLACSYTVPTLTRTTYDNVTSTFTSWSYQNNYTSGNYNVIETDPADNQTVHRFAGDLETERVSFQGGCTFGYSGCLGSGTIRRDVTTCYNGNTSSITACQGLAAAPSGQIVQTDVYTKLDSSPLSLVETKYDSYGNATSVSRYDYGATFPPSGTIASQVSTSFDASGSCGALSIPYMQDRPCSIVTYGSGVKTGETDFQYDAAGHVLSAAKEVDATHFPAVTKTYNANGTLNTETDVNGALYTYAYGGAGGCNNLLPTSVKTTGSGLPSNGLLQTTVWDCNGAVPTQITDANGQSKGMGYADALWRLTSSQDELGNTTNYSYFTNGSESVLNFGTNSTSDVLTTSDGLQRPIFSQRRQAQGSSSFDTVQTSYSWTYRIGLMTTVSNAYSGGAAQAAPSGTPVTTTQYDVLGRPTTVTDGAGGTTTYTYSGQDVLVSIGPAPAGENPKRRQLEYDGLGRLTSVCELTTATGSGSCGQVQAGTGFVTRYAYDGFGDLTTVMQNAQGSPVQTRTYTYDGWSRLTSEKNPEWAGGTTSYTYDSDSTGACSGTYEGDLVKKTDVAGNVSCLKYDALHRQTSVSYPSGPSAANTPTRTFVYDSTGFACPAGGTVVGNVAGRLAEAYTGSSSSKITDVGLCYTARGEISDVFTSTAHSGGYFHTASSYLANGTVNALAGYLASGATFVPTIFYTTDGEGRWYSATATSGPNPLTNVFYNPSGTISALTFGSNDTDSFLYDSADRMKKYTFTLNGTSEIGTPTWNANGSLASLAVTDPFNSANVQTCTYSYDDLSRITSANCGSVWAQTFGYDPFGNLTKNGSVSWQPGYDQTTNRYTLSGTGYDSNGNLTNDSFRAYTWDSNGRPVAIGNKTITYDALGRMAEKLDGGVYSQFVYTPVGSLMARMTGQAGSSVRIPLAGSWAVYGATQTFNHYEHLDWLGNSRLSSGQSRTMISDMSYAPFGEVYGSTSGTGVNFTGMRSDVVTQSGGVTNGLYDFPARELPPTQGRWLSPDPSGIASANPLHPQTWNRYAYVGNNPLGKIDPSGLFCAYLNDAGTGLDKKGVDDNSNFAECAENGGYWIEGSYGGGSWVTANADLGLVAGLGYNSQGNSEVSVAGAVDSNGVGSNPFGAFTLTVSGTFNLPVNELMWAAQQTTPVSGPWHYGNWAGPGGMGSPINKTDAAALTHDYCYAQGGFTPGSNFQQANPQLQACNQQLCDAVRARSAELSYMTWQAGPAAEFQADGDINQYFTYIVRSGNACH